MNKSAVSRRVFRLFEISVSVQAGTVVGDELLAFFDGDAAFLDGTAHPHFEAAYEFLRVVLYVFEHIGYGFTVNGLVDAVAVFVYSDVYGIGVAEEVVHVTEYFLVSTYEEDTDVVVFVLRTDGMQREVRGLAVVVDIG